MAEDVSSSTVYKQSKRQKKIVRVHVLLLFQGVYLAFSG